MSATYKTLEFFGGELKFSSGHFTIFSQTERETLHGHTYTLQASLTAALDQPGITFDYRLFREKLIACCQLLNRKFLLAAKSPYLSIDKDNDYHIVEFAGKKLYFLHEDILLLPLTNITLEELSQWFIDQIVADKDFMQTHMVANIVIKVFNSPEHCAVASFERVANREGAAALS